MATFEYSLPDFDVDRACILVDEVFDVHLLRTEEGIIIDVWEHDKELLDAVATENPVREEDGNE